MLGLKGIYRAGELGDLRLNHERAINGCASDVNDLLTNAGS